MSFIQGLLARLRPAPATPPAPQDQQDQQEWTLTLDQLFAEMASGKRRTIDMQDRERALNYERGLLPKDIRYPRLGDVYEALQDQPISYLVTYSAPYSGDGEAMLLLGDQVWIHSDPADDQALGSYALAVAYDDLEQRMVPTETRDDRKYTGFHFFFRTADLATKFKLIETDYSGNSAE